jgi:hypothetical protein
MTSPTAAPATVRRLDSPAAAKLAGLAAAYDDLQTVLRCCERLVGELRTDNGPDELVVESVWTVALLSYARCFAGDDPPPTCTEADLDATELHGDVHKWHAVLLQLRDYYADPRTNPREQFSVGVAQDDSGGVTGVAVTSARQPMVDDVAVRQAGAIAFALTGLLDNRIVAAQEQVLTQANRLSKADLDRLVTVEVIEPS